MAIQHLRFSAALGCITVRSRFRIANDRINHLLSFLQLEQTDHLKDSILVEKPNIALLEWATEVID
ncbi:protein of unknown function [Candidatus Nitrotoga arctica]|uniref:Uncharacterized protein n=1 Tax=Candidatus Nitrotoga arctica TaxID=453162 RepID=A0ABN8AJJ3_9PROT|nr:protein of unknown function [Candidatus Nitrotoga arctica]